MKEYCLALDLKDDSALIEEYINYHKEVWPEILKSIRESGIEKMEIYRIGTRLCMTVEANDSFSFEKKAAMDASNPVVQEWEQMLWNYQQKLPMAKQGEKWMLMEKIFSTEESKGSG